MARGAHAAGRGRAPRTDGQGLRERDDRPPRQRLQGPPLDEGGETVVAAAERVRVRVATVEDAPRLLPLFEAFYGAYFHPTTVEAIRTHMAAASDFDIVLLAEEHGVSVGFASLRLLPQIESGVPHAELSDLYVDARHRRRGIGRALVASAETLAADKGCARLTLIAGLDNEAAGAFYRSVGFEDFGRAMSKHLRGGP